jgi:hypothetical protein
MKRQVVDSKIIGSVGFDPLLGEVEIEFKTTGGIGKVKGVTVDEWNEFLASPSKGTHWNRVWKRQKDFSYEKGKK